MKDPRRVHPLKEGRLLANPGCLFVLERLVTIRAAVLPARFCAGLEALFVRTAPSVGEGHGDAEGS